MPADINPRWLGRRVVLRRPVPAGHLADALGDLVALDPGRAVVETTAGPVEVPLAGVVAARLVEPTTPEILALERVSTSAWRAQEVATSADGWLLRANGGVTRRANSALALTTPKRPLAEAVAEARDWYAARGLPLDITVPMPARSLLDGGLEEYVDLVARLEDDVHVFAARLDRLLAVAGERSAPADSAPADSGPVELAPHPDDDWFTIHRDGASSDDPVMHALVRRHDHAVFATIREQGQVVAIGRASVDTEEVGRGGRPGRTWLGVTGLAVHPDARRRGLARRVLAAMWGWGADEGATHSWLQVSSGNQAAIRLYLAAGYWHHHDYRYRRDAPEVPAAPEAPEA